MVNSLVLNIDSIVAKNASEFAKSFEKNFKMVSNNMFDVFENLNLIIYTEEDTSFHSLILTETGETLYDFYHSLENTDIISYITTMIDRYTVNSNNIQEFYTDLINQSTILNSLSHNTEYCKNEVRESKTNILAKNFFDEESIDQYLYEIISSKLQTSFSDKSFNEIKKCLKRTDIKKIIFHDSFYKEFVTIDKRFQKKIIRIFTQYLMNEKEFSDFNYHGESDSVLNSGKKSNERKIKFSGTNKTIYEHLKLNNDVSIYIKKEVDIVYVGHITHHLTTKNH